MTVLSLATWAFGRRPITLSASSTPNREAQLRRLLGWAAPAGAAFCALAAAAGAALRDRPTVFGALALLATVAMVPLLLQWLAVRVLARLDTAITERITLQAELDAAHKTKEELRDLAYHDDLTGLPNRSLLYDRLGLAITQSHRQASHLALLFLDLDDFKAVNDSFGHTSGDRLLAELASRVRGSVRAGDTVARFGGDEFIVLLDSVTGAEDAARVAAKVLDAVQSPFRLDGHEVAVTASVGVSVYPRDGTSADELVKSADAAMYRDKPRAFAPLRRTGEPPGRRSHEMRGVR
jgi:diguanylate cyclase (GGDEF)-like protein